MLLAGVEGFREEAGPSGSNGMDKGFVFNVAT